MNKPQTKGTHHGECLFLYSIIFCLVLPILPRCVSEVSTGDTSHDAAVWGGFDGALALTIALCLCIPCCCIAGFLIHRRQRASYDAGGESWWGGPSAPSQPPRPMTPPRDYSLGRVPPNTPVAYPPYQQQQPTYAGAPFATGSTQWPGEGHKLGEWVGEMPTHTVAAPVTAAAAAGGPDASQIHQPNQIEQYDYDKSILPQKHVSPLPPTTTTTTTSGVNDGAASSSYSAPTRPAESHTNAGYPGEYREIAAESNYAPAATADIPGGAPVNATTREAEAEPIQSNLSPPPPPYAYR